MLKQRCGEASCREVSGKGDQIIKVRSRAGHEGFFQVFSGRQREREERRTGDMVTKKAGVGELCRGKKRGSLWGSPRKNTDIDFLHY